MNDERRHRNGTQQRSPVVTLAAQPGGDRRTGLTLGPRWREHRGKRLVRKPSGVHRARIRAVNARIWREQRLLVDAFENRAICCTETRQRIDQQILLPVSERTHAVDKNEPPDGGLIALGREHCQAATPRVAVDVPHRETECLAEGWEVTRVVFDASAARAWWSLGCTSPALVVQDQLPVIGERSKSRPQEVVIEQKPTVYADKRNGAGSLRREKHGKVEPACVNGAPNQARRSRARASKSDEAFAGGDLRRVETAPTK